MHVKWLSGLVVTVSASCLWALCGVPLGPTQQSVRDELLTPAMRQMYREHERLRRSESTAARPLQLAGTSPVRFEIIKGQIFDSKLGYSHETVPMKELVTVSPPCHHVEVAPAPDPRFLAARQTHDRTTKKFVAHSGFGFIRVIEFPRPELPHESDSIASVQLVSLLVHEAPSIYVIQQGSLPVERRPLDSFENLALDQVRVGADLVWSPEHPQRMFGAIRATASCLDCHTAAREHDLLGAFTYSLKIPVEQLTTIASK